MELRPGTSAEVAFDPDPELVASVDSAAAGDEVAFARIVAAYHADLVRVAYVVTGERALAEDAVQSAWTIAWQKLPSVRDPGRVRGWLVSVAANEARQLIRRRRRRAVVELHASVARLSRGGGEDGSRDPAAGIAQLDLAAALALLDPKDRALLAMRYVVGLDSTEISATNGMSASGTRARLARLLRRLRKELEDA